MDGDSRGGAALSVREVSGAPIKFVGTGEKMDNLEPFYPERMADRILGMGDMLTLYEKAVEAIKVWGPGVGWEGCLGGELGDGGAGGRQGRGGRRVGECSGESTWVQGCVLQGGFMGGGEGA
jgi:hypothetical protein